MSTADEQDNELFDRLEELVGQIPAMQEQGKRLAHDAAARKVLACAEALKCRQAETREADALVERAEAQLDGTPQRATTLVHAGLLRGMRTAPLANAQADLDEALAQGGFASVDEAQRVALPEEERAAIESRIAAFQQEYAQVLAACEALEPDA